MRAFSLKRVNVEAFMKALDSCKGEVKLITDEGDCFNLRSKLSQIAGIMNLIESGKKVNAKIKFSDPEDENMLASLDIFGAPQKKSDTKTE